MGRSISSPTESRATVAVSSAHQASSGEILLLDTSGGSTFSVTLPANPRVGDRLNFIDAAGNLGSTKVTVARNGHKIANIEDDLDIDIKNTSLELYYTGSSYGWSILSN